MNHAEVAEKYVAKYNRLRHEMRQLTEGKLFVMSSQIENALIEVQNAEY